MPAAQGPGAGGSVGAGAKDQKALYVLAAAGAVLVALLVLLAMGRTPFGTAQGFGLWTGAAQGALTSQRLADPYTFTHVSHGLVFFLLLAALRPRLPLAGRFLIAIVLESAWEVLENTPFVIERFREATVARGYYGDSVLNAFGDILACAAGFAFAAGAGRRGALAAFLLLEVLLAFWIRDNLTLNVLMLLAPIPAIREWQAG